MSNADVRVIMGSTERRGAWQVPNHLDVRVWLGSAVLDLTSARLSPGDGPILRVIGDATLASCEIVRAA
jgi:hypothetical protein